MILVIVWPPVLHVGQVRFAYWIALLLRAWKRPEVLPQFLQD